MKETKDKNIWVPMFVENVFECVFFSVEITHGAYLSKEIYSALFFQKLVKMIDESIGEDLIEDIELYFPSLIGLSTSLSNEDIVLKIVESEEFYYGFPPIQDDSVECIKLEQISEKGIDGCDRKEFFSLFEENYNIYGIIRFVTDLHDSFLANNSEHVYDTNLSLSLSNQEKSIDKVEKS